MCPAPGLEVVEDAGIVVAGHIDLMADALFLLVKMNAALNVGLVTDDANIVGLNIRLVVFFGGHRLKVVLRVRLAVLAEG